MTAEPNWINHQALLHPNLVALRHKGREWTFENLRTATLRHWQQWCASPHAGDGPVALLATPSPDAVMWLLAFAHGGVPVVLLHPRRHPDEWALHVADAGAPVVVTDGRHRVPGSLPHVSFAELAGRKPDPAAQGREAWDIDEVAHWLHTSGSSGRPKRVGLTWRQHASAARASVHNLGLAPGDVWVSALPLAHVSGLSILMRTLVWGVTTELCGAFDTSTVLGLIDHGEASVVSVVPTMLADLLDVRGDRDWPDTFRAFVVGGAPVPQALKSRAGRTPVVVTWGMTETASHAVASAPRRGFPPHSGRPLWGVDLRIQSTQADGVGEIQLRSDAVSRHVLVDGTPADVWTSDGWFRTGDLGHLDSGGRLHVHSRMSDLIISGGENIRAAEVEACLMEHPGVRAAAVLGVEHTRWGAVPVAVVVSGEGVDELRAHCAAGLAPFKVPHSWRQLAELPTTALGKVDKGQLRTMFPAELH